MHLPFYHNYSLSYLFNNLYKSCVSKIKIRKTTLIFKNQFLINIEKKYINMEKKFKKYENRNLWYCKHKILNLFFIMKMQKCYLIYRKTNPLAYLRN